MDLKELKGCIIEDVNLSQSEGRSGAWETLELDLNCNGEKKRVIISSYGYEGLWGASSRLNIEIE